jgi:hypothetical protein
LFVELGREALALWARRPQRFDFRARPLSAESSRIGRVQSAGKGRAHRSGSSVLAVDLLSARRADAG